MAAGGEVVVATPHDFLPACAFPIAVERAVVKKLCGGALIPRVDVRDAGERALVILPARQQDLFFPRVGGHAYEEEAS
jgi:hypothetical protein